MRRVKLNTEEYYHIYNRGVDKRNIFIDARDYERYLYLLFACNDTKPLLNSQFYYRGFASIEKYPREREQLVDIVCFCLMPNHFHAVLRQKRENGISLFMQKIGTGYTMYFNTRYKRSGVLFQGVFKSIHIDEERYLTHLTRYIHLNPIDLKNHRWKEANLSKDTYEFVRKYNWSSYADYLGHGKFSKIINPSLLSELYRTPIEYENFVKDWTSQDLKPIEKHILL